MSELRILALDPATYCGFAHSSGISGTWDLSTRTDESVGMRLVKLRALLSQIKEDHGVDLVAYEAVRYSGMARPVVTQSEIQGVIKVWCEDNLVEYTGYSSTAVKKHATGKGNASKEKMILAAEKKWGRVIEDDNEADALWILDLAMSQFGERK